MTLEGKVAVITGASRGIGKATALAMAKAGADLVLAARTETTPGPLPGTLAETVAQVEGLGRRAVAVRCNVASQDDLDALVSRTVEAFGRIDVLVNNAAFTGVATLKPTAEVTRREWELQFAVNVHAPFMLTKGFLPHFPASGGVVLNVTSAAANLMELGEMTFEGEPVRNPAYGATKAALNRIGNSLASELRPRRIAVITVDPGVVASETMQAMAAAGGRTTAGQLPVEVPAAAMAYLGGLDDPSEYNGKVVDGPALVTTLGLNP
jgi:3-oxoacyl-[acyl-carrier protein] reductase